VAAMFAGLSAKERSRLYELVGKLKGSVGTTLERGAIE
jgi:hypothetical protein